MTSIPTTNLLISSEGELLLEALSDLSRSGGNLVNKVQELNSAERGGILLFSNQANPNFISLEHNFMGKEQKITIKFIDPKGEFETNYFGAGSIWRDLMAKSAAQRKANSRYRLKKSSAADSAKKLPDVDYEELEKVVANSQTKPLFLAYGIGSNASQWSSVHRCVMTGIVFDNTASREFTLTLAPYPQSFDKNDRVGLFSQAIEADTMGFESYSQGYSQRLRYENIPDGEDFYRYKDSPYSTDYHFIITDAITDYIRRSTGGANVIVLLPDLNKVLERKIKRISADSAGPGLQAQQKNVLDVLLDSIFMKHVAVRTNYDFVPTDFYSFKAATKNRDDVKFFNDHEFYARISSESSDTGTPDFMAPLEKVFTALKKYSTEGYTFDTVYFTETDSRLLNFWGDDKNKNKLTLNSHFVFEEGVPTVVVGDPNIIHNLLVPRPDQEKIPLSIIHPINLKDLNNKKYTSGIKNFLQESKIESAFGNISQIPDVFQFKDDLLSEKQLDIIEENKIPVFRHNTSNPNVTKIKLADEGVPYLSNLNLGYIKQVERLAVQLVDGKASSRIRDFKITNMEELTTSITRSRYSNFGPNLTKDEIVEDIKNRVDSSLEKEIVKDGEFDTVASYIKAIIDNIDEEKSLKLKISQEINADPASIVDKMAQNLAKTVTKVVVNTLPIFSISTKSVYQFSPAVVFSQDIPMKGQVYPRRTRFNNYLTGVYQIIGWKHSLGPTKAESVFVLAKINTSTELKPALAAAGLDLSGLPQFSDADQSSTDWFNTMTGEEVDSVEPEEEFQGQDWFNTMTENNKEASDGTDKATHVDIPVPNTPQKETPPKPSRSGGLPTREDGTQINPNENPEEPFTELWRIREELNEIYKR